ncbi:MAG: hypothetical protein ACFNYD_01615 [Bacteroides sp.]
MRREWRQNLFAYIRENYGLSLREFLGHIHMSSGSSSSRVGGSEYTGRAKGTAVADLVEVAEAQGSDYEWLCST